MAFLSSKSSENIVAELLSEEKESCRETRRKASLSAVGSRDADLTVTTLPVAGPIELDLGLLARSRDGPRDEALAVPNLSATGPLDEDRLVPGSLDEERDAPIRSGVGPRDDERTLSSAGPLDVDLAADDLSLTPALEDGLTRPDLSSVGPRDVDRIRAYLSECPSLEADRAREDLSVTAGCEGIVASGLSMRGSSVKLSTQ